MNISYKWLKEYVDFDLTPVELAEALTSIGLEVGSVDEVQAIKGVLIQHGALGASMSGTGPTVFGLFDDPAAAREAWAELKETYRETFCTETLERP